MAVVQFTAKRSLAAGFSLNDTVTMNLILAPTNGMTAGREVSRIVRTTISLKREIVYFGADLDWEFRTIPLSSTDAGKHRMFLDSCEAGEVFLFSPYQVVGDTYGWSNAIISSEGWTEERIHIDSVLHGQNDRFTFSFTILKVG